MKRHGLVLAGGGARGAYEVGILTYLFEEADAALRARVRFRILCGTSVGALNVSAVAAFAHDAGAGMRTLVERWKSLTLDELIPLGISDVVNIPAWLAGKARRLAIFGGAPIERVITEAVPWAKIRENIAAGHIEALSVTCTRVSSGDAVVFYENRHLEERPWSRDPNVKAVPTHIGPEHALASAAIPLIFPAVQVGDGLYVDGGLRQNTPLSPALRLGAESVLVVGVGHARDRYRNPQEYQGRESAVTKPFFLLGKVLDALLIDHIDYDLIQLRHFNQILEHGAEAFGQQFVERLNAMVVRARHSPYRVIPHLVLRPSQDIGMLAADFIRAGKFMSERGLTSRLIRTMARSEASNEADLASYILFDGGFASRLIELGMEDAHAQREALLEFFSA